MLVANRSDWWIVGESMQPDGMLALMKWEEETPFVYFFKHGLDEEKVVRTGSSCSCVYSVFAVPCVNKCIHADGVKFYITLHSILLLLPSLFWHCWLGGSKSIWPVKTEWWGVDVVICLERGADCLHMVQLMPLHPKTPSSRASFKSRLVLPFQYRHIQVVLENRPLNGCRTDCLPLL